MNSITVSAHQKKVLTGIARHLSGEQLDRLIKESSNKLSIKAPKGQNLTQNDVRFIANMLGRAA